MGYSIIWQNFCGFHIMFVHACSSTPPYKSYFANYHIIQYELYLIISFNIIICFFFEELSHALFKWGKHHFDNYVSFGTNYDDGLWISSSQKLNMPSSERLLYCNSLFYFFYYTRHIYDILFLCRWCPLTMWRFW